MAISQTERDQILKIVAGLFNGAPGGAILNDLSQAVEAGVSMAQLADILADTNQFKNDIMGGKTTTADQVGVLLEHFGLTPDDEAGSPATMAAEFFTARIEGGAGFGAIVLESVNYLNNTTNEAFAPYSALLNNKALVASVHADNYATIAGVAGAQAFFVGVTSEFPATAEEALQHVTDIAGEPVDPGVPGETFTLTSGVDDLEGTANNDTFNAPIFETTGNFSTTLQSVDTIDGGAGTDTLNLQLSGNEGIGGNVALENVVSNIEIWNIRNFDGAASTLDLENVGGIQQLWNNRSAGDLVLNDVAAAATVGMHRVAASTTYTVNYAADALGADDEATQAVAFSDVGDAEAGAATLDINADGIDVITSLNATVAGANVVDLGAGLDSVENLVLSGAGSIVLTANNDFANLESLDASALTGTLDITVDDGVLDGVNTLVGGQASDDVLRIDDINAVDLSKVSGFEVLGIGDIDTLGGSVSLDISDTDFSSLIFGGVAGAGGSLDLAGVADGGSVTFERDFIDAVDLSFDTEGAVTISFANDTAANDVGTITGDDLTALTLDATATDQDVAIDGITQNDPDTAMMTALTVNVGEDGFDLGNLDLAKLTTLTVNGSLTDDEGESISGSFGVAINGGTNPSLLSTIDLSGYNTDAAGSSVATIDASGADFAGAVTILVGEGAVDYTPDTVAGRRETFKFVGEDIGEVTVGTGFSTSVTGDRLDFSEFANVTGFDNLSINIDGGNAVISAAGDEFEGSITLMGVTDINTLEANSFVF